MVKSSTKLLRVPIGFYSLVKNRVKVMENDASKFTNRPVKIPMTNYLKNVVHIQTREFSPDELPRLSRRRARL